MPVFNGERTVREALESVLAQTHENLEVLVYNNGSTDGTEAVVLAIERDDPRVKYQAGNINLGSPHSFSETFRMSSGPYFMWLAADDRIEDSFVESGVRLLESDPNIGVSAPVVIAISKAMTTPSTRCESKALNPMCRCSQNWCGRSVNSQLPVSMVFFVPRFFELASCLHRCTWLTSPSCRRLLYEPP